MSATAKVEYDPNPKNVNHWWAITTGPSGVTSRKRFAWRQHAIDHAASFLAIHDDDVTQARVSYEKTHREVKKALRNILELETEPDK